MLKPGSDYRNYPISPDKEVELYTLYLNGKSFAEIQKVHPKFGLGQIVYSYIKNDWAEKKQRYLDQLLNNANTRAVQAAAESVDFVADVMFAQRKYMGELVNTYNSTGVMPEELKPILGSLKNYKDFVEMLSKLTGQDNTKTVKGTINVNHQTETGVEKTSIPASTSKPNLLAQLAAQKKAETAQKKAESKE